jgi:hypothetical protein
MKKAITFSGQSRFVRQGYETLKRNLYDFQEYDVFIHTWEGPLNKDCDLYKPKKIIIEPQKNVIPSTFINPSYEHFVHFSMFYSMKESLRLKQEYEKENNFKYDLVIRTRFDIGLETVICPELYDLKKGVYSPNVCMNPSVISDWFNFSDSETIDLYSELYDNMTDYHKKGVKITAGEAIITHMLDTKNIPIKKIKSELFLLRDRSIHLRLSPYWKYAN